MGIIIGGWTGLALICIVVALFILYAIGNAAGQADERNDAMWAEMEQEQADAEAYRRLTE